MQTDDVILKLEELLRNARPVPLTNQVRLNPADVRELLVELRDALEAERRKRPF